MMTSRSTSPTRPCASPSLPYPSAPSEKALGKRRQQSGPEDVYELPDAELGDWLEAITTAGQALVAHAPKQVQGYPALEQFVLMGRYAAARLSPMPMPAPLHVAMAVANQQMGDAAGAIASLRQAALAPSLDRDAAQAASAIGARLIGSREMTLDDGLVLLASLIADKPELSDVAGIEALARRASESCFEDSERCTNQAAALYHRAMGLAILEHFGTQTSVSAALKRSVCAQAPCSREVFESDLIERIRSVHARTPTQREAAAVRRYLMAAPLFNQLSIFLTSVGMEARIALACAAVLGLLPAVFVFAMGTSLGVPLGVGIALGGVWAASMALAVAGPLLVALRALAAARSKLGRSSGAT